MAFSPADLADEHMGLPPEILNLLANQQINPESLKLIQALARNPGLMRRGPGFRDILFEKAMRGVVGQDVEY